MTYQDISLSNPIQSTRFRVHGKTFSIGTILAGAQYSRIRKLKKVTFKNNSNIFIIAMDEEFKWRFIMNMRIPKPGISTSDVKPEWDKSFNTLKEVSDWILVHLL